MRKHAVLASCAAGALIAALCLSGADRQGHIMFIDALKALGAGATPGEFERHYLALDARDPALSLNLAILYPWLATGAAWERIYAPTAARTATGAGGTAPPRSGAPVDRLTITEFSIGTTSFVFHAKWPPGTEFPAGTLDFMSTPDLTLTEWGWSHLADIPVNPAQGYADIEVLFDDLPSLYMEDLDFTQRAFFKLRVTELEEWWGGGGDKDDDGDPPGIPPPDGRDTCRKALKTI